MSERIWSVIVIIATFVTILLNGLASAGLINGVTAAEVSDRYPTVLTPAGWAFAIWGLIYLGLTSFSIYQFVAANNGLLARARRLYIVSCVLNCAWILFWHYGYVGVCALVILGLLATLIAILFCFQERSSGLVQAILTKGVFGVYAGWVTAASLVNVLIFTRSAGIEFSPVVWNVVGVLVLLIAAAAAVIVRWRLSNFVFPLAVAWAATGIAVKQSGNTALVVAAAVVTIVGLVTAGSVVVDLKDASSE